MKGRTASQAYRLSLSSGPGQVRPVMVRPLYSKIFLREVKATERKKSSKKGGLSFEILLGHRQLLVSLPGFFHFRWLPLSRLIH